MQLNQLLFHGLHSDVLMRSSVLHLYLKKVKCGTYLYPEKVACNNDEIYSFMKHHAFGLYFTVEVELELDVKYFSTHASAHGPQADTYMYPINMACG